MSRAGLWLAISSAGEWAAVTSGGAEFASGRNGALEAMQAVYSEPVDVFCQSSAELERLIASVPAKGRPDSVIIRQRDGWSHECAGFSYTHGASFWLGSLVFPDPVATYCRSAGWATPKGEPIDAVRGWCQVHEEQTRLVSGIIGQEPTHSLSSSAFRAAVPKTWRRGGEHFGARVRGYAEVRQSCYGGRIECYRPGWSGQAVEFDIRSAYGWALTEPLPDWQLYERRAYPGEAEWLDVTAEVSGEVGPLPVRLDTAGRSLFWPRAGKVRGWYARPDLERSGLRILDVHAALAGRMSLDLAPHVSRWLELREQTTCRAVKATVRGLAVGLAGKLWQRSESWGLWHVSEGPAPMGATPLGDSDWLAYPCKPRHIPVTLPTAASYVTAMVRSKVWPWIADGRALYTHTDSVHIAQDDADDGFFPELGDKPGQWSVKAEGFAHYKGVNAYTIGKKRVGQS